MLIYFRIYFLSIFTDYSTNFNWKLENRFTNSTSQSPVLDKRAQNPPKFIKAFGVIISFNSWLTNTKIPKIRPKVSN